MFSSFEEIRESSITNEPKKLVVAAAEDKVILESIKKAQDEGLIHPILVGDAEKIEKMSTNLGILNAEIVNATDSAEAVLKSAEIIRKSEGEILMKGNLNTSVFMRGVLNKEKGLRGDRILSLLAVYQLPQYHKLLFCSDSGINVAPDFERKKDILLNSLDSINAMGIKNPKVAILAANELVDPKVQATVDAAELVDFIEQTDISCTVEGPIAFDVAFNQQAAEHKKIDSQVSGDVDLIIFPNIEAGNILGKSWMRFNEAKWAGLVLGAKCPIILGSRSDTSEIKMNSIALAVSMNKKIK